MGRAQGQGAEGTQPILTQHSDGTGKAALQLEVGDDQRLLMLPDPPRRYIFYSEFSAGSKEAARRALQIMQAHHVLRWIVQHQAEMGKIEKAMQTLGKIVQQFGQIPS